MNRQLLALVLLAACGGESAPPREAGSSPSTALSEKPEDQELRELAAIGYANESENRAAGTGVLQHDPERAAGGLNLVVSGHAPEALLIDMAGATVHRWRVVFADVWPERPRKSGDSRQSAFRRARLLPDGGLLVIFEGLGLVAVDRNSELRWSFAGNAHHDLDILPDGRIAVLTREAEVHPELAEEPILCDSVTLLEAGGRVLEVISFSECIENSPHRERLRRGVAAQLEEGRRGPVAGDVFHTNTLELLPDPLPASDLPFEPGQLLISIRNLDLIATLDLERRSIPWVLAGTWYRQHQPTLLLSGNLLLFDNGRRGSRVLEVDPRTGAEIWSYTAPRFFSKLLGSCQVLSNGNVLVTESKKARAFEVTRTGEVVWEYVNPHPTRSDPELLATLYEVVRVETRLWWLK